MSTTEIRNIEVYKNALPLLDIYPEYQTLNLPTWVLENIENARVYGNKKRGVILEDGRKYHLDNKLNSMTGRDWTIFINNFILQKRNGSYRVQRKISRCYRQI